jgi:hypothetical protein
MQVMVDIGDHPPGGWLLFLYGVQLIMGGMG